jgi:hypothetical protein
MIDRLRADGPLVEHRDALMLFGQFVGTWRLAIRVYDHAGQTLYDGPGEWSFGWVLDGRAVQDVLTTPSRQGSTAPGLRGIGSTLRLYVPALGAWRMVWAGAATGTFLDLTAREAGEEIHVDGRDVDGSLIRWGFSDIRPDCFHWTGLSSPDDGATWWTEQVMDAERIA